MQKDRINQSESAQAISDFLKLKLSKGLKENTIEHYRMGLEIFEDWRTKPYEELTQMDMCELVMQLRATGLKPTSIELRMHPVKSFLRWKLTGMLKGPSPLCCVGLEIKKETRRKPDIHVTTKILEYVLREMGRLDQKVYFTLLYDTGARRGEILNLTVGDVGRDENGMYIEVDGKTGYRKNWLHESIGLLVHYINTLPSDPKTFLFAKRRENNGNERLSYGAVDSWMGRNVKKLKRQGILNESDKFRIHSFRHTKARTLKNRKWANDQINVWMGWTKSSNMASYYGQAREEDVVKRFLEDSGRAPEEVEDTHHQCPVCLEVNGAIAKFCNNCANTLRPEFAYERNQVLDNQKIQAELKQARDLINQLKEIPHLAGHLGIDLA